MISEQIIKTYQELGSSAVNAGDTRLADRFFRAALKHIEERDDSLARLGVALCQIAAVYARAADYRKAEATYKRAFEVFGNVVDPDHVQRRRVLDALAELSAARGKLGEAARNYRRALASARRDPACPEEEIRTRLKRLAWIYLERGRLQEAEEAFTDSLMHGNADP